MTIAWVTADEVAAVCAAAPPGELTGPIEIASGILFELTGQKWPGPQSDIVRPCTPLLAAGRTGGSSYTPWIALPTSGWCGCDRPTVCGCPTPSYVTLPGSPVTSVEQVVVDGVTLGATQYRLIDSMLIRDDGGTWPCCQDLAAAGTEPGAWQVSYTWGAEPDAAGRYACAVLACELWRAGPGSTSGGGGCRLPQRVTSITRQGVTMALLDPMAMFPDGMTGIPEIDLWLGAQRYGQAHRPATVMVPGARQRNLRD